MSNPAVETSGVQTQNRKTSRLLTGVIVGMFIFAFASIPLYRIVCAALAPGGSSYFTGDVQEYVDVDVDESRTIRVHFTVNVEKQLPWDFGVETRTVEVHPGEKRLVNFWAKNLADRSMRGKSVYDIYPPAAARRFKKIQCFCFEDQTLASGEHMDMPLYFWFDPGLPDHIEEITVAYTFFNSESSLQRSLRGQRAQADR